MCGKDVNSYIGGEIPIAARASLIDRTSQFTALAISSVQTATVAFIGTADGVLHKVGRNSKGRGPRGLINQVQALIEGEEGQSHIYKSMQLSQEGMPLLGDVELDEKNGLLYMMSRQAVYKVGGGGGGDQDD